MYCELCNEYEATISIRRILENGKHISHKICDSCARKYNIEGNIENPGAIEKLFSLIEEKKIEEYSNLTCFSCGTRLSDILRTHHLGCNDCLLYFKTTILSNLKKKMDLVPYSGKRPKEFIILNRQEHDKTVNNLKSQLEKAVEVENFELAAYLRDKIKELGSDVQ